MAEKPAQVDFWGVPLPEPKDRRGRKAHVRNDEVAKNIALSRATGSTVEDIAELVGLDPKTLNKYYSRELEKAPELVEAVLDRAIFEQAMQGRVGAQRLMKEMLARGKAAVPLARAKATGRKKPTSEPLGKKAQASADAVTAHQGTSWGEVLKKPH